ncbi:MAG: DUF1624 domain-containing protein [Gammaproteobacteria bacterium]
MISHPSIGRLHSIDMLRGLVMVLMTLDHTRDFFSDAHFSPTNLDKTNVALFLTRWITHYCAPTFVFIAGTSAYLWASRRGPNAAISRFLLERGLFLLLLTCTVEAWSWNFYNDFREIDGGVLWAIAWSMIVLALLAKLPLGWTVSFGMLMIVSHNAFDTLKSAELSWFGPWWAVLHTGDDVSLFDGWVINPYYPLIPWIGVMAVGYGFGKWMTLSQWRTRKRLLPLGLTLIAMFAGLRYGNFYGDPDPWQTYPDPVFTLLSFLNCHKYPPSLLYLLMTLGPTIVVLALLEDASGSRFAFLQVFGRTPLFFYLLHLYLIHGSAVALAYFTDGPASAIAGGGIWSPTLPTDYGYSLAGVYLIWLIILFMMYPICQAFEAAKKHKPHWKWLHYF